MIRNSKFEIQNYKKMSNFNFKPLIFLLALSIIGLTVWAYPVIKSRYFTEEPSSQQSEKNQDDSLIEKIEETTKGNQSKETIDSEDENSAENEAVRNDTFVEILPSDCDNDCSKFSDSEDADYCKQVCGLVTLEKPSTTGKDCAGLEDLQKDYCFKDLAIEKTDAKICEQIDDKNIRNTCKNRIMEDIIDEQMEGRDTKPL